MLSKYDYDLQNDFHLSGAIWFMNVQLQKCQNRDLYILSSITKPSLSIVLDCKQLMVTNTANKPSHEREKHTKIIITNKSEP